MPRVSVIIPTYNRANMLSESIYSILDQNYQDFELICVDDGSTDDTADVVEQFDGQIVYARLPVNQGISAARNLGLSLASGEFIAVMDSDDVALPGRLKAQVDFLDSNKSIAICGTGVEKRIGGSSEKQIFQSEDDKIKALLLALNGSCMSNPTTMMRASFLEDHNLRYTPRDVDEDHDMWIEMMLRGAIFYNLPEIHVIYKRHAGNITSENSPLWLIMQKKKTDIRLKFLLNCFSDLSYRECRSFAKLMEFNSTCNILDVATGLEVSRILQKRSKADFNIYMPYIHIMARRVEEKAVSSLKKIL